MRAHEPRKKCLSLSKGTVSPGHDHGVQSDSQCRIHIRLIGIMQEGAGSARPAPTAANVRARVAAARSRARGSAGASSGGVFAGLDLRTMGRTKLAALIIGVFALCALLVSTVGEAYVPIVAAFSSLGLKLGGAGRGNGVREQP